MKKILQILLIGLLVINVGCSNSSDTDLSNNQNTQPLESKMRAICELATMDCYFNNVAKYTEENAEGILWWSKDKKFWVEYSGVVSLGIDASLVKLSVDGENVTITIPEAKILDSKVDETTLTAASFIFDKDSADITADDQIYAFGEAQKNMEKEASNDTALLASAQQRAQILLEDYIMNIGDVIGIQYNIEWIYLDSSGNETESTTVSENEEETVETKE